MPVENKGFGRGLGAERQHVSLHTIGAAAFGNGVNGALHASKRIGPIGFEKMENTHTEVFIPAGHLHATHIVCFRKVPSLSRCQSKTVFWHINQARR